MTTPLFTPIVHVVTVNPAAGSCITVRSPKGATGERTFLLGKTYTYNNDMPVEVLNAISAGSLLCTPTAFPTSVANAVLTVAASPMVVSTAAGAKASQVFVTGGTITSLVLTRASGTVTLPAGSTPVLGRGDTLTITYSVAPSQVLNVPVI